MIKRKIKPKNKKRQQIRKRKNPYVDSTLSQLLTEAFVFGNKTYFSHALIYYGTNYKCDDCGKYYDECTCEGDREIQGPCKYCDTNYCLCDYDIFNVEGEIDKEKLRKEVWKFARDKMKNSFGLFAFNVYNTQNYHDVNSPIVKKFENLYKYNYRKYVDKMLPPPKGEPEKTYQFIDQLASH